MSRSDQSVAASGTTVRTVLALLGVLIPPLLFLLLVAPLPQDPAYHLFADRRTLAGIANFANVVSNLPLVLVGLLGLLAWRRGATGQTQRLAQGIFFAGALLTAAGSSAYHWQPENATLVWDRAPMTLMFMSLFCMVIDERVSPRLAAKLLLPLCAAGLLSVGWWAMLDDLRPYALVHFYSLALMMVMIWWRPSRFTLGAHYWLVFAWYALAKVAEAADAWLFGLLAVVSGHSLKHLFAAAAAWWVLRMLTARSERGHAQAASTQARHRNART